MKTKIIGGAVLFVLILSSLGFAQAAQTTERLYLSGHDRDDAVRWEFRCTNGPKADQWSTIPVPSNWEMHGFGTLSYSSKTPADVGEYRYKFTTPSTWAGERVFLVFDGSMTDTTVRLNGQQVGPTHRGGFYRFKYEVTALLKLGAENLLEATVEETSSDESVNRAERTGDYWNFGGIFRPVWLEVVPTQFIERIAIDARADGNFYVDNFVNGTGEATEAVAQIRQLDGTPVGVPFTAKLTGDGRTRIETKIDSPKLWNAETPHLYQVEVQLRAGTKITHTLRERFGFRTFEVRKGDAFYLNGHRVVLQGVNRHSFNPEAGRCLTEKDHREDIRLMHEMNMNAVRMSHYPPDERFLELCDELGLYVLDELSGWQKRYSVEAGRPLVAEMVQRDVNHPSILFWDNGNEGGWEPALDGDFAKWDPQARTVLHPWDVGNGINTIHYRSYSDTAAMAKGEFVGERHGNLPLVEKGPFIFMPTEFLHGLYDGGAGAGLEDYWNAMRNSPHAGGGFIWVFVDEGVKRPDTGKIDVCGNAAPDGILGPYREKEASFYTIKELWSPIVIQERELSAGFDGTLTLENRYGFTNASACKFSWKLLRMPEPGARSIATTTVAEGIATSPAIAPGRSGKLSLKMPTSWLKADLLALRVEDPNGHELWTSTWPLPKMARLREFPTQATSGGIKAAATDSAEKVTVIAGDLAVEFSKTTGRLLHVQRDGKPYSLTNGPRLAIGDATFNKLETRTDGSDVIVTASYSGLLKSVVWRVRANGWLDCEYSYTADKPSSYLGVCFDYPETLVKAKRWVGEGPYRTWQNRRRGTPLGAYENAYNDTITGFSGWVYPEFKGCFAGVRWFTLDTSEGPITTVVGSADLYVQVLTPSSPPEGLQRHALMKLPTAGLAFLHEIPALGEKGRAVQEHGPQSQLRPVRELYRGKVSFRFGD